MLIEENSKLDFSDVLIRPKRSTLVSRKEVDLFRTFYFRHTDKTLNAIPIIASNMDGVGTFHIANTIAKESLLTCLTKTYQVDEYTSFYSNSEYTHLVAYTMGISDADFEKFNAVYKQNAHKIQFVCIDVANGYSERFSDFVAKMRDNFPSLIIAAGNVVTGDMTTELILKGADIVKCGIGSGSVCTTRIQTGIGYPQLSAIIECSDAAHGLGGHIISDGGCTSPGDVAKAFGAGADFVMLGGMLAGHTEGGGEVLYEHQSDGTSSPTGIRFYGMSSDTANKKHFGGLKNYRSAEGRETIIPYKGDISSTINEILGGIRSCCTYVGATKLKSLTKCTTFIKVHRTHNTVYEKYTIKD